MSTLCLGEHHRFEAGGRRFLYLVPSAAIVALDPVAEAVTDALAAGPRSRADVIGALAPQHAAVEVDGTLAELTQLGAVREEARRAPGRRGVALAPIPVATMVLGVTNQCNLSCTYCYEYGEDKIVDTADTRKPKSMSVETARQSVDFLMRESGPVAHVTFFGGETLLNFDVLETTVAYAKQQAQACGKQVDFSVTTNATLLRPEVIDFLAVHDFGVTISIDGPADVQDRFRVFKNGAGSYETVMPKIRALIDRHRSRPIGARVTLTRHTLDVTRIYRHLVDEVGFWEVGFAPVTSSASRDHAIAGDGFDHLLEQFRKLAEEFLAAALANRHHGFSNVRETVAEIHKGASKAWPCGAGFGLVGVATDGDVALCHRFAGSDQHKIGTVATGIDRGVQAAFLEAHHVDHKTDCRTCWARPLCAGGCYHEAHTRHGDTTRPNLHYCEWVRGWTDVCLRVYGEIAEKNPAYFHQLEDADHETREGRQSQGPAHRAAV